MARSLEGGHVLAEDHDPALSKDANYNTRGDYVNQDPVIDALGVQMIQMSKLRLQAFLEDGQIGLIAEVLGYIVQVQEREAGK